MKAAATEEILQDCLQRMARGASLDEVLALYPARADELRPLLETAMLAGSLGDEIHIPSAAQLRSRARFLDAAASPSKASWRAIFRTGWSLASLVTVLALALVGTGFASAQSLPGDELYAVKLAAEQARLQLVRDPAQRLQLTSQFDRERVDEVEALISHDQLHPVEVNFAGFLSRPDPNGDWMVGAIHLLLPPNLPNLAELKPGRYVDVHGAPAPGGRVLVERIQPRIEQLSGAIQQIGSGSLTVDQLKLDLTQNTHISGSPAVGDVVEAQVERQQDGSLEAHTVDVGRGANLPAITTTATTTAKPSEVEEGTPAAPAPQPAFQPTPEGHEDSAPRVTAQPEGHPEPSQSPPPTHSERESEHSNPTTHPSGDNEGSRNPSGGEHIGGD